ncbi:hypothetical protein [Ensifer sp. LCM 4579]|uniref:hypothetical protein n=1 Tax=Ensifer sp. LCM 4579 TaxID=1848292 RepID=UPI0008DA8B4E|nr:hypothetical protein [Ensifer sp. LCM 4579]OHV78194.1 hypothetical protein LCM4579_27005 [Ensifer sp. LCM 4579]
MTYAAIRRYDPLFRDQIDSAPMAHRPSSLSSGLSYEDGIAVPVFTFLASHPRRKSKDALTFAEPSSQHPPIQPIDVTAVPALAKNVAPFGNLRLRRHFRFCRYGVEASLKEVVEQIGDTIWTAPDQITDFASADATDSAAASN